MCELWNSEGAGIAPARGVVFHNVRVVDTRARAEDVLPGKATAPMARGEVAEGSGGEVHQGD